MSGNRYYGYHGVPGRRRGSEREEGLFGWTVFLFLLVGFVFLCWMGSYYIFANPEKPANYRLLLRLKKIDPPQRFEVTTAPRGEFLKPGQLLEHYGSMTSSELRRANEALLRNFLRNYHQNRDLVPYAVGTYRVLGSVPLGRDTFCPCGLATLLQAVEQPEILLEQVFTTDEASLQALTAAIVPGLEIKLEKPVDLSALIHVARLPDNRLVLTTMPLLYGSYGAGQGHKAFVLAPPSSPNLEGSLPVVTQRQIGEFTAGKFPARENSGHPSEESPSPLRRITEEPPAPMAPADMTEHAPPPLSKPTPATLPSPKTSAPSVPAMAIARAIPVNAPAILPALPVDAGRESNPSASAGTKPVSVAPAPPKASPTNTPEPRIARALPAGTPLPTPVASPASPLPPVNLPKATPSPSRSSLPKPMSDASPSPSASPVTPPSADRGAWPIYEPGKMPRGRLVDPSDAPEMIVHGISGERRYLRGRFTVSASGNGRAVLRPQGALPGVTLGSGSKVRIIVDFPNGYPLPSEGNSITRDNLRPFQITSVRKGDDGQINVYVREITRGQ